MLFSLNSLRSTASIVALSAFMISTANAALHGNIGIQSDYFARGLDQTGGATLQGGIDYSHSSGFYAGSLFSNVKWFDINKDGQLDPSYEWDAYAGFAGKSGALGYDIGILNIGYPDANKFNTVEVYAGGSYAIDQTTISAKVYFSPDRNAYLPNPKQQDEAGWYANLQADIQLQPTVTLTPQIGYAFGDALDQQKVGGLDKFINYSVGLHKSLEQGFTASFSFINTDRDGDKGQVVVGLKKNFSF